MAGHYPLKKEDEPKLFQTVEAIKVRLSLLRLADFQKIKHKGFDIMKLSKDYVENPKTEIAFTIGKVSLVSIADEHPSLTQDIAVEVHLEIGKEILIKDIFWVA